MASSKGGAALGNYLSGFGPSQAPNAGAHLNFQGVYRLAADFLYAHQCLKVIVGSMSKPSTPNEYTNPEDAFKEQLLFNLVYCSQMSPGVKSTDVDTIIATSRRRNSIAGITGILVFGDGVFFQWIEGPKAEVTALVKLIETDPRHELMVTLSTDEEIRERVFPTWDMELVDAENIQEVLQDALETAQDQKSVDALQLMLEKLQERN